MVTLSIQEALQLALQHHQAGRFQQAEAIYRQVLQSAPNHPDALHLLGAIALQRRQHDTAIEYISRAIQINPAAPHFYLNLAKALRESGRLDEAVATLRQAAALDPTSPAAHHSLGNALLQQGRYNEAIAAYREAIQLKPDFAEAHYNLGNAFRETNSLEEAIAAFQKAIMLKPDFASAHYNLSNALREVGRYQEALAACENALRYKPDHAGAHLNKAVLHLLQGDFTRGWPEYKWRWLHKDIQPNLRHFPQPEWSGEDPAGHAILLHAEQGYGDSIQFVRYAPLLAQRGARVFVECPVELKSLFQTLAGVERVLAAGEPLPHFDLHIALLDLPRAFATTLDTIPAHVPYLHADPRLVEQWRHKIAPHPTASAPSLSVGLCWAGNPKHHNDRNRSIPLRAFAPLAKVKGVRFYSLQKSVVDRTFSTEMDLVDFMNDVKDFADTAALIANLDLVISVDTAPAHLAGALAKPVWTLLPFVPDWRWMLEREDSPWYPTMRLFRQPTRGDWDSVIQRVAQELAHFSKR